jgi:hypothetical protein
MGVIGRYYNGDFSFIFDTDKPLYVIFVASSLMLILGAYITEPYFSKPSDVIAKSIAMLLVLASLRNPETLVGYSFIKWYSLIIGASAIISILLLEFPKIARLQREIAVLTTFAGRPKIFFSILYLTGLFSFFSDTVQEYFTLLLFWLLLIFSQPIEKLTKWIFKFLSATRNSNIIPLGQAIGFQNPFLYKVEIDLRQNQYSYKKGTKVFLQQEGHVGNVGIVFNIQQLLNKQWLNIYVLKDSNNNPIKIDIKQNKILNDSKYIFSKYNQVYLLETSILDLKIQEIINENELVKDVENFLGFVSTNSNINFINFNLVESVKKESFGEGEILKTKIDGVEVLYQVIDGNTREETLLDKDIYGFTSGKAKKIGLYNHENNELEVVRWLPEIYTPVFLNTENGIEYTASDYIGKLPSTNMGIPIKEYDNLVTHNTAILGILGIGKSCLTFELLQKLINNSAVKVLCIDITNQYSEALKNYILEDLIQVDISDESKKELKATNKNGTTDKPSDWGNLSKYVEILDAEIGAFVDPGNPKRILTLNPDWHSVGKAATQFKIQAKNDLTVAEKTRFISERLFIAARKFGETTSARFLIVFEEAHSLVPEWNSVSNEGDKQATNGTAKVILQGRKYGLGSMVVTQRTANISKSILNQCNTIFALRVFDDTGKQFLENYIGQDYSNVLPTLEERHAIAIGKAMKLKQPVILELNDLNEIILTKEENNETPTKAHT